MISLSLPLTHMELNFSRYFAIGTGLFLLPCLVRLYRYCFRVNQLGEMPEFLSKVTMEDCLSFILRDSKTHTASDSLLYLLKAVVRTMLPHSVPIPLDPRHVAMLAEPSDFYRELIAAIRGARQFVLISSLYFSDDSLALCVLDELGAALGKNPRLVVKVALSYQKAVNERFITIFSGLLRQYGQSRLFVSLVQLPLVACKYAPYGSVREVLGVLHIKLALVDYSVCILTGANISEAYFTNKWDRYVVIRHNRLINYYYLNLFATLESISHPVTSEGAQPQTRGLWHWLMYMAKCYTGTLSFKDVHPWLGQIKIQRNRTGYDPLIDDLKYIAKARDTLSEFLQSMARTLTNAYTRNNIGKLVRTENSYPGPSPNITLAFPLLQYNIVGINHTHQAINQLLNAINIHSVEAAEEALIMTSPYLNIHRDYLIAIKDIAQRLQVQIITSSLMSNGWAEKSGIARLIPLYYEYLQHQVTKLLNEANSSSKLLQFTRPDYTFHSKGLEYHIKSASRPHSELYMLLIGGYNYGVRSVKRDIEHDLLIVTTEPSLIHRFRDNTMQTMQYCKSTASVGNKSISTKYFQYILDKLIALIVYLMSDYM